MRKKLLFISMVLLGTVLLSACSGSAIRGSSWPGLAADGDVAYLASGSFVYAVNVKDGKELWRYPESAGGTKLIFYAAPVVTDDGLVIVGSAGTEHNLIAINPADIDPATNTPLEAWTFADAKDHWVASPLVVGNKLFAPNSDGNLYVLDLSDGRSQKQAVKTVELGGRLWAQPVTDGKHILITSLDHSVYAVDTETYDVVWHEDIDGAIAGSPIIGADGMLYIGSLASQLEQFDPETGQHKAVFTAKNWIWGTPVVDGDALYFGDVVGNFYSFNTSTQKLDWSIQPDGSITASPLVLSDYILVATETGKTSESSGTIFAISRAGDILWSEEVGGTIYTTPVVSNDLILVSPLGADGSLYAYDMDGRGNSWSPFTPGK